MKNKRIGTGKYNYRCRAYGRQFVLNPTKKTIVDETKRQIDKLLLEKLPLASIVRAMEVSKSWLQSYVNQKHLQVEQTVKVQEKKGL